MAWARLGLVLCALGVAGCALIFPFQRVAVQATPGDSAIFVDGKPIGVPPLSLNLRADRDHSIFVKRHGYRPELVIVRSLRDSGKPRLDPASVKVVLLPLTPGREVEVEVERPAPGEGSPERP